MPQSPEVRRRHAALQSAIESMQLLVEKVRVPEGVEQRSQCQQGFELLELFPEWEW